MAPIIESIMKNQFSLEENCKLLHIEARLLSCAHFLKEGSVPPKLQKIVLATRSLEELLKYNPNWQNQPRLPAGDPGGGQWTDGGGGSGGSPKKPKQPKNPSVDDIYDPPLEPVYPELLILPFLRIGRIILAFRRFIESGRDVANWTFGSHKSPKRWATQIEKRNWTPQEITQTIKYGRKYPAPNHVKPENRAVRYLNSKTGKYVVRDEVTKEILQISGDDFIPLKPLH